jgi:hypothetical protein
MSLYHLQHPHVVFIVGLVFTVVVAGCACLAAIRILK